MTQRHQSHNNKWNDVSLDSFWDENWTLKTNTMNRNIAKRWIRVPLSSLGQPNHTYYFSHLQKCPHMFTWTLILLPILLLFLFYIIYFANQWEIVRNAYKNKILERNVSEKGSSALLRIFRFFFFFFNF